MHEIVHEALEFPHEETREKLPVIDPSVCPHICATELEAVP